MKSKKIKVIKCVKQPYEQQSLLITPFAYFHWAVNESIRIGIDKNLTSAKAMNREMYGYLQTGLKATYAQTAYEMALAMLKAHRKLRRKGKNPKIPYMKRDCIKITNQNYKIKNSQLHILIRAYKFIYIKLEKHTLEMLKGFKHGGLTITPTHLIFTYSKIVTKTIPDGWLAGDINFNNFTTCDTNGKITIFDTSKLGKIARQCRKTVAKFKRNDVRKRQETASKYGKIETDRKKPILHSIANHIAKQGMGVFLEDLTGIRERGKKPGKQSKKKKKPKKVKTTGKAKITKQHQYKKKHENTKKFRTEINNWGFYQLQFMIAYKLGWRGGLLCVKVNPAYTSSKCSIYGGKITEEGRMILCTHCGTKIDRDINASINILVKGMRIGLDGRVSEAMVRDICGMTVGKTSVNASHANVVFITCK